MITETLGYTHHDIEIMSQKKKNQKKSVQKLNIYVFVLRQEMFGIVLFFFGGKNSKLLLNLHYLYTLLSSFYLYLLFTFFMNKVCFEQMFRTTTIVLSWLCKTIFSCLRRNQKC